MISTDPQIPIVPPMRTHVSLLASDHIDRLVSEYLFKQPVTCTGHLESSPGTVSLLRCTECQATIGIEAILDERGRPEHPRSVPYFSTDMAAAWSIVDRLRAADEASRTLFVTFLDLLVRAEYALQHTGLPYSKLSFVMGISPRLVCIAALQAMDILDIEGYLRESEAGQ